MRIEVGPRDLEKEACMVARRDTGEKFAMDLKDVVKSVPETLETIQSDMLARAQEHLASNIREAESIEEMVKLLDEHGGFVKAAWDGSEEDEKRIQEKTKATIRIVSEDKWPKERPCILTGKKTDRIVYFARAY